MKKNVCFTQTSENIIQCKLQLLKVHLQNVKLWYDLRVTFGRTLGLVLGQILFTYTASTQGATWYSSSTMCDFHNSTDTLKFWTEKRAINKTFLFMKLGEIVVHMDNYNFTKFHQNQMKNKKVLLIAYFSVSEFESVSRIVKIVHCALVYACFEKKITFNLDGV